MLAFRALRSAALSSRALRTFSTKFPPIGTLSEEEEAIRDVATAFANEVVVPKREAMDAAQEMDKDVLKGMFETGLMGIEIPEEYNGVGASFTSACLVIEELARVDPAVSVCCDVQNTLCNNMFRAYGNEDQKKEFWSRMAVDTLASFGLSEVSSGSDALSLKTTAVKDGEHYVLNGSKAWITNAAEAGVFLIMANAAPEKGYKGITCFIVERGQEGFEVMAKEDKLGIRASSTCGLTLDNVRVHKDNILGAEGQGARMALSSLNEGRLGIAAQMLGLARGAMDATLPYIRERKQFNTPIADFQAVQHRVAELATQIEAARLLTYNGCRMQEAGQDVALAGAQAKYIASEIAQKASFECVKLMGGVGFMNSALPSRMYRDSVIGSIYEGTTFVQLSTIARHVL